MAESGAGSGHPTASSAPLLEVSGLTKRFGTIAALQDVDLHVRPGEIVALVGETGAGKSTLVGCVAGILEPDGGAVRLDDASMPASPDQVRRAGVEIVWQEHGLCDELDVVANVGLGRERWLLFSRGGMREQVASVLRRLGAEELQLDRPIRTLSRGQRQLVALGRALLPEPRLLVLDEPTASLSARETLRVQGLVRDVRDAGTGVLLVTHDLEQVFGLADRIVVLRAGRVVADVSPLEVQRADIVALMSGIEMDSVARRQLQRLRSLVDQLSDVEPGASLPLIVSAMAAALGQDMLCVHLLETPEGGSPALRRSAAVGLPEPMLGVNERLPLGADGGCAGLSAESAETVVVDDLAAQPVSGRYREAAAVSGIRSEWAAPIVGTRGVLGAVTGFGTSVGHPEPERLELARLYLGYAASAIERERLLAEVSKRNRILESLRGLLESLAGPERVEGGLAASLSALARGIGADAVGVLSERDGALDVRATSDGRAWEANPIAASLRAAAARFLAAEGNGHARLVEPRIAAVPLRLPEGRGVLVAHWPTGAEATGESLSLLDDAGHSLALAMEGEALESALRETVALRRSETIHRELLSWLSHELRTPLTAIHGYASTLNQTDLTWDPQSTERFLRAIAAESARMERLVGDLLDSSAIESGVLRLQRHWCDPRLVIEAALDCVAGRSTVRVLVVDRPEAVWGDHDRLEQVFVNLLENAVSHGYSGDGVEVTLRDGEAAGTVEVEVRDHGPGLPPALAARVFTPHVRGATDVAGAGLGLSIARGIVEAHGGTLGTVPVERGTAFLVTLPSEPPDGAGDGGSDAAWNLLDEPQPQPRDAG